jgi:hypothetical protein
VNGGIEQRAGEQREQAGGRDPMRLADRQRLSHGGSGGHDHVVAGQLRDVGLPRLTAEMEVRLAHCVEQRRRHFQGGVAAGRKGE